MSKNISKSRALDRPTLWPISMIATGIRKVLGWGIDKAKSLGSKTISKVQDGIKGAVMATLKGASKVPVLPAKK